MVHTDTCFSYHGVKLFLPDTVDHRNGYHIMIPFCTTFLCLAALLSVSRVNGLLSIRLHNREILVKRYLLAFPLTLREILQEKLREIP